MGIEIMETMKKFVRYYEPYKGVFFLDLVCAAVISFVDLVFPQILRMLTKTLFAESSAKILSGLLPIGAGLFLLYFLQTGCKCELPGAYDGSENGTGYAAAVV